MAPTNSKILPFSFSPSQRFEGPDGQWSSFVVRAGTPEQTFRVLPSTVTSEIFLPMAGACKSGMPSNCAFLRGAEQYQGKPNDGFQSKESTTWKEIGIYKVNVREELGYNASGLYGLDQLGLLVANSGGPTLSKQVIGSVTNPRLWVGRLGMDNKPSNFSGFDDPQRSLIKTLKEENLIPSLSYGYTAGAYYKKPSVFGSLTFGGYDQSRFVPHNITFPFDANDSRKPSTNIQAIVTQDLSNTTVSLLPDGAVYSLVDFAEPQMWLPTSACDAFARAFNLTYDNSTGFYLIDPTTRAHLLEKQPTITFGLGTTANPGERVNIVLPYSAFDQQVTYPIYPNTTKNYFPIRRAVNDTQYTIGRTFFQEAYFRIDYERENFSIHQALFPTTSDKQNIISVESPGTSLPGASSRGTTLEKGAIAGISIGALMAVICIGFFLFWICKRRRRRQAAHQSKAASPSIEKKTDNELADVPKLETDGVAFFEKDSRPVLEMEAKSAGEPNPFPEKQIEIGSRPTLDTVVEVYEMDNTEVRSAHELESPIPNTKSPPPGWV